MTMLRIRRARGWILAAVPVAVLLASCSSDDVSGPDGAAGVDTLLVAYANEGLSPSPCNDRTPIIDGVADTLSEAWNLAPSYTLDLRDESGGSLGSLEIRALWTHSIYQSFPDYVYFLARWNDATESRAPDRLAYGTGDETAIVPGPVPAGCDSALVRAENWTRLFPEVEDEVLVLLQDENGTGDPVAAAHEVFRAIGVDSGQNTPTTLNGADVWLWRAGRTNDHPIAQYVDWTRPPDPFSGLPEPLVGAFTNRCGFFEDLFVDASGTLLRDQGSIPYIRNFTDASTKPIRIYKEPPINVLPPQWAMWWDWSEPFGRCDTLAATRASGVRWSENLYASGAPYDWMSGWGLRTPSQSQVDVRARGRHVVSGLLNGWTLEWSRALDTGNPDDIAIDPVSGTYRIVIGIADDSGKVIRVTRSIRLVFSPAEAPEELPRRC
jgi:hypothetical protein